MITQFKCDNTVPLALKILLKAVFHATENESVDVFREVFLDFCSFSPICHDNSHVFMSLSIVLVRKMSEPWLLSFLKPEIILSMRYSVLKNQQKGCIYLDYLCELYNDMDLDNKLEMKLTTWAPSLRAREMFDEQNFITYGFKMYITSHRRRKYV